MNSGNMNNNVNYNPNISYVSSTGSTKALARTFYQEMQTLMKEMADPTAPLVSKEFGITLAPEDKNGFLGTMVFNQTLNVGSTAIENSLSYESFLTKIFQDVSKMGG